MVYSFFDPDLARDSLGSYIILDHVALAARVRAAARLSRLLGARQREDGLQGPLTSRSRSSPRAAGAGSTQADTAALVRRRGERPAISEQVAAIELPATK